ncbi:MAG: hypothetical protein RBG13Loki_3038 [Promethearchaeota archaeon CR_4]|nr:MAG: hypothetical protein RBG13Loki_3038 [Candidatus Lokiarchaeota archaeon CR_4]
MKEFNKQVNYTKDGVIDFFGERIVLFPPDIISLLSTVYGQGAEALLVFLGKKMGRRMSEKWEESLKPVTLEQFTNLFCQFISTCGWGRFDPVEISEQTIVVNIKHNITEELDIPTKHICYFIKGLLLGFGEYALYRADVQEIDCTTENKNKTCVFEIRKKLWRLIPTEPIINPMSPEGENI